MAGVVNKRFLREVRALINQQQSKEFLDNDYLVYLDDSDTTKVSAIIKPPTDSVYRHKFIRLDLTIPEDYPHSPPDVKFVNHDGIRIHPNMYENGKCCSTILNTWGDSPLEKWTSSMGIETVLITFHSFLDDNPYTYEPGGRDDPSYTVFVLYASWQTCLLRYLQYEKIDLFTQFIQNYMLANIDSIFADLSSASELYPKGTYRSRCFEIGEYTIDYLRLMHIVQNYYNYIDYTDTLAVHDTDTLAFDDFMSQEYKCGICFDTENESTQVTLHCGHTFDKHCLLKHTRTNSALCSMCRSELTDLDHKLLVDPIWTINPLTKRRIKINGPTHRYLIDNGHLSS
ncbi:MAG: hypothetical protein EBU90_11765 [Proteobacteria bacterium]|nr:hypothetical protein [Pseudomonadota bacterium]NBP14506.1 hypothetical protein [bacterium]